MRRALAAAAVAALFLSGCAGSDEPTTTEETPAASTSSESPSESASPDEPTESPSEEPTDDSDDSADAIEIEIEGDRVEPNGLRVKVAAGEPLRLAVESDRAAEFHVHSSPEQVLDVEKGTSTLSLTIDRPGLVDVEEHDSGRVVLQLEVR